MSSANQLISLVQNTFLLNLNQLKQIHTQIITNNYFHIYPLLSHFLSSCCQSKKLDYALLFLQNIHTPNSSLYNTFIKDSIKCQEQFVVGIYNTMRRYGNVEPDNTTFSMILRASVGFSSIKIGESFHCHIFKLGFGYELFLQTGLLDFYSKVGDLSSAKKLFDDMPERDVVACNAMISALGMHGYLKEGRELFDRMREKTSSSWNTMISCYCKLGDVESARMIFDSNPVKNVISWNAMIDGHCKLNQFTIARELFDHMGFLKNTVTWNTMISGYIQRREFGRAISTFQDMQAENAKPTVETMVSLLSACPHLGALDMGYWIHGYIRRQKLKVDVYLGNALVDNASPDRE